MTNSLEETRKITRLLNKTSEKCRLEINKLKSNILIYNNKYNYGEKIENIEITESIKYLGVMITNTKDCFRLQKEKILDKANKMANLVPAIIHRSSNKLLIGKTFWKNVALPKFLFATTVIPVNQGFMQKLQTIENKPCNIASVATDEPTPPPQPPVPLRTSP